MKLNARQADECERHGLVWDWKGPNSVQACIRLVLYLMAALILHSEARLAKVPQFHCLL